MARREALDLVIGVRIPAPQPNEEFFAYLSDRIAAELKN